MISARAFPEKPGQDPVRKNRLVGSIVCSEENPWRCAKGWGAPVSLD